jgi:hypothetical protein
VVSFSSYKTAPGTHLKGGWVGSTAGLDAIEGGKISSLRRYSNSDHPIVQPAASSYTD